MALELIKVNEFPTATDLKNWMVVADANGISYKISIDNVKSELGIGSLTQLGGAIVPTSPAPPAEGDFFWIAAQAGTYTNYNNTVVPANSFAVISRVSGVWSSSITGFSSLIQKWTPISYVSGTQLIYDGQLYEANTSVVSTDIPGTSSKWTPLFQYATRNELFDAPNLFDLSAVQTGFYINQTTGSKVSSADSWVSDVIPVVADSIYIITGANQRETVFYDAGGVKLRPYTIAGDEMATFQRQSVSIAFKSPPTAVSVQFTVRFNGVGDGSSLMFTRGSTAVPYQPFGSTKLKQSIIPDVPVTNSVFVVEKTTDTISSISKLTDSYNVRVRLYNGATGNRLYNLDSASIINRETNVSSAINGYGGDDSGPSFFNNYIIGGNHGRNVSNVTSSSHGKTLADVGSVYKDSNNRNFTILRIVNSNSLILAAHDIGTAPGWSFPIPAGTLTYVSNGSSTDSFSVDSVVEEQLYPSVKNTRQGIIVDTGYTEESGTYYTDTFVVVDEYDIIDSPDMVAKLTANRPSGGYLTQPDFKNGDAIISVKMQYNFQQGNKVAIQCSWYVRKDILLNRFFGITQNVFQNPAIATGGIKRYFPNTLPITSGGNTYDFRLMEDIITPSFPTTINFTSSLWENGKPTSRVVDLISGDVPINFNLGYLPVGGQRADMVSSAWEMNNTKKLYPRYVDGKIGVSNVVDADTLVQGVAFRGWTIRDQGATNIFIIESGGKHYMYLDYHVTGKYSVQLPANLLGKEVSVISKSANITLKSTIASGSIDVIVVASSPMYAFCELLIE